MLFLSQVALPDSATGQANGVQIEPHAFFFRVALLLAWSMGVSNVSPP
jgi:hypothetical protein